jgi:hypothetical protein
MWCIQLLLATLEDSSSGGEFVELLLLFLWLDLTITCVVLGNPFRWLAEYGGRRDWGTITDAAILLQSISNQIQGR